MMTGSRSRALVFLGVLLVSAALCSAMEPGARPAEVLPYLQHPATDAMTILWFTKREQPDTIEVEGVGRFASQVEKASALAYSPTAVRKHFGGVDPGVAFRHRVRVGGLEPGRRYAYRRLSDGYAATLTTLPGRSAPAAIRFIVYADSETEPESTGKPARWPGNADPQGQPRLYPVDQTDGYAANLAVIARRAPLFIAIAGDLVESGGEQRDWDEFWRHNAGLWNDLAGRVPILAAVGNHENFQGEGAPSVYSTAGAGAALAKYRTYLETPDNGSGRPEHAGRYYSVDVGPMRFITLDTSAGSPHRSERDTNWHLVGDGQTDDLGNVGAAPDFNPGSPQYAWLERQLADGHERFAFIFVQFHHAPYSVGPHGLPPGDEPGHDPQSGVPVRILTPLFKQYSVAAVFCGHDEMYEHSVVDGIHFYDVGVGGDGLRGPSIGPDGALDLPGNPHQVFLAHTHAPEVWQDKRLVSGGKHYGHVEINLTRTDAGRWQARIEPVYVFPLMNDDGNVVGWERRVYDDVVTLEGRATIDQPDVPH